MMYFSLKQVDISSFKGEYSMKTSRFQDAFRRLSAKRRFFYERITLNKRH